MFATKTSRKLSATSSSKQAFEATLKLSEVFGTLFSAPGIWCLLSISFIRQLTKPRISSVGVEVYA